MYIQCRPNLFSSCPVHVHCPVLSKVSLVANPFLTISFNARESYDNPGYSYSPPLRPRHVDPHAPGLGHSQGPGLGHGQGPGPGYGQGPGFGPQLGPHSRQGSYDR